MTSIDEGIKTSLFCWVPDVVSNAESMSQYCLFPTTPSSCRDKEVDKHEQEEADGRMPAFISTFPEIIEDCQKRFPGMRETQLQSYPYLMSDQDTGAMLCSETQSAPLRINKLKESSSPFSFCSWFGSKFPFKDILRFLGPGWLVAMAYVDPGNLEGDLVVGSVRDPSDPQAGFRLLWVLVLATLLGFLFQHLAIKLGVFSGRHLAQLCRQQFPRWFIILFWINIEASLLGADIQSVIGSAISLQLLFGVPFRFGIIFMLFDSLLVLFVDMWGTGRLEACFAFFISIMSLCFFINMYTSKPNILSICAGLVPLYVPRKSFPLAISLIGSVVMPHNFFLQSAVVQVRSIERRDPHNLFYVSRVYTIETFILLLISLFINLAVIVAFANPEIITNQPLSLYNAHIALKSFTGKNSSIVWGVGLLASGQCATVASIYAGQFIMEGFFDFRFQTLWSRIFVTRIAGILPLLFLVTFSSANVEFIASAINILQAFNLPLVLLLLVRLTSHPDIMGKNNIVSTKLKNVCFLSSLVLIAANVYLSIFQLVNVSLFFLLIFLITYLTTICYVWFHRIKPSSVY